MEPMFTKTAEELKVEQLLQRIYTAYEAYDGVDNTELNRAMADAANACATFLEMKSLCLGLQILVFYSSLSRGRLKKLKKL